VSAAEPGPVVGVDVGGTKLLAVRLGPGGEIEAETRRRSPRTGPDLVASVLEVAKELSDGSPGAVGLGVPGLVDTTSTLLFAPNLPGAAGTAIGAALLEREPQCRFWIGNDATAACWGEFKHGAGVGYQDVLMATLGTGIGGGIVTAGRLVEGANRFAGEFGHMVVDPDGPLCPCGRRGCWERYASGAGLARFGQEAASRGAAPTLLERSAGDPEAVKGEHVTAAALSGDPAAVEIMNRFGWWVALGLANLVNLFDPQAILIGGGLVEAGEALLQPTRRAFLQHMEASRVRPPVTIRAAQLGPRAGAIGAALLASQ
jgi:glucokinase